MEYSSVSLAILLRTHLCDVILGSLLCSNLTLMFVFDMGSHVVKEIVLF